MFESFSDKTEKSRTKKLKCFTIDEINGKNKINAGITDFTGFDFANLSWHEFQRSLNKSIIVVIIDPHDDNAALKEYLKLFRENENEIKMRLILLTDNPNWKKYSLAHYLYVLPLSTKDQELRRLYFQLKSYLVKNNNYFSKLIYNLFQHER